MTQLYGVVVEVRLRLEEANALCELVGDGCFLVVCYAGANKSGVV